MRWMALTLLAAAGSNPAEGPRPLTVATGTPADYRRLRCSGSYMYKKEASFRGLTAGILYELAKYTDLAV